jgi:hypothetical protein
MRAGGLEKWYKYQSGGMEELSSLLPPSAATAATTTSFKQLSFHKFAPQILH